MQNESEFRKFNFLFDYTKFHIGMYVTLLSGLVGVLGLDLFESCAHDAALPLVLISLVSLAIAGAFGSLVASSIPMTNCLSYDSFMLEKVGPRDYKLCQVQTAIYNEHAAFWLAVISILIAAGFMASPEKAPWVDMKECTATSTSSKR